jgi:hypothetical protein
LDVHPKHSKRLRGQLRILGCQRINHFGFPVPEGCHHEGAMGDGLGAWKPDTGIQALPRGQWFNDFLHQFSNICGAIQPERVGSPRKGNST